MKFRWDPRHLLVPAADNFADPSMLTKTSEQASQTSSGLPQALSRESILDSLKLILGGADLGDVFTTVARLIEAQILYFVQTVFCFLNPALECLAGFLF